MERARALHAEALAAYDARPGARDALGDRLDVMLREQRYAAERQAELGHLLATATTRDAADAIRLDLAWARDDHERATARCAELRARMADLTAARPAARPRRSGGADRWRPVGFSPSGRRVGRGGAVVSRPEPRVPPTVSSGSIATGRPTPARSTLPPRPLSRIPRHAR